MPGSQGGQGGGTNVLRPPRPPKTPKPPKTPAPTPVVPPDPNAWAYKPPTDVQTLLRQLSANVGQSFMPMGPGGDVRTPAFGSSAAPQMNVDPAHYGETGGETNFFSTTTKGGMAPIWSAPGSVPGWDPLGLFNAVAAKKKGKKSTPAAATGGPGSISALINSIFPTQ